MKTVVVGLSGGVDSSVSAYLLKKQGYNVIGLHMKGENAETSAQDEKQVKALCEKLNIKCVVVDYANHMQIVKDYFVKEYLSGNTPNPCVICNKEVKFKPFLKYAKELGADYYATGHYARIEHTLDGDYLKKAVDTSKDQSYFLCQLSKEQLSKVLFPLGELTKAEVKQIAMATPGTPLPNTDSKPLIVKFAPISLPYSMFSTPTPRRTTRAVIVQTTIVSINTSNTP